MAYERRTYAGGAPATTITGPISDSATSIILTSATGWPTTGGGPFYAVLDEGTASEEKIKVTDRTTVTLTATRGVDGSSAMSHAAGAAIRHCWTAVDADEANYAVSQTVGGVTTKGDLLVGTAANTLSRLGVGTAGQALVADTGEATGLKYASVLSPTLADAKGDLLAATAADTITRLGVGTDGQVLTADAASGHGLIWRTPTVGPLQVTSYAPAGGATKSTTSATLAALDTTNLSITFTVPASGKVLFMVTSQFVANRSGATTAFSGAAYGVLNDSGATIWGPVSPYAFYENTTIAWKQGMLRAYITGLTPGAATWRLAAQKGAGETNAQIVASDSSVAYGATLMEVWAA
jgi:hypothetical protein